MASITQLASDDNNPDFVGAHNPDTKLWARFYNRPRHNRFRSNAESRPVFEDHVYVEIRTPGDALTAIDRPASAADKARFPMHWAHFMNTQGGDPAKVGTPVEQWPRMTPAMCEMLKAMKFTTVESIALASDQQIASVGMIAGMAPLALRDAALLYLKVAKDAGYAAQAEAEKKAAQDEMAAMRKEMEEMRAMLAQATAPKEQERKRA